MNFISIIISLKILNNVTIFIIFEAGHTQSASVRLKNQSVKVTFRRQTCQMNAHCRDLKARGSLKSKNEKNKSYCITYSKLKSYHSKQHFILSTLRSTFAQCRSASTAHQCLYLLSNDHSYRIIAKILHIRTLDPLFLYVHY